MHKNVNVEDYSLQFNVGTLIYISENDDKKGNAPLVKSPSTETTSRFSFFWRNKSSAKTDDKATDEEGKFKTVFSIKMHFSGISYKLI